MSARSKLLGFLLSAVFVSCAPRAHAWGPIGGGSIPGKHTHSSASDGGSTLAPSNLTMPVGSSALFSGTVTIPSGAGCVGLSCRVSYSSGPANSFVLVIPSSATWVVEFGISASSGATGASQSLFNCTVNGDATAGHYFWDEYMFGTASSVSSHGIAASLSLGTGGGGTFQTGDFIAGTIVFRQIPGTNRLDYHGNGNDTSGGVANFQAYGLGGHYVSTTVGLTSWTVTCAPQAGTVGIVSEVISYQVGK